MIYLNFTIQNPWHNDDKFPWNDLGQKAISITKNKTLEYGLSFYPYDLFELSINTKWRGEDHAGPRFNLNILGLNVFVYLIDNRHWNYDENRWVDYSNEEEVKQHYES